MKSRGRLGHYDNILASTEICESQKGILFGRTDHHPKDRKCIKWIEYVQHNNIAAIKIVTIGEVQRYNLLGSDMDATFSLEI